MSSSSKFPSGLNDWAGSDKPERTDFNSDNEIIDSNAMWKDTYDPKANPVDLAGPVETAGGIPAYALARADYDPNGSIAGLGGIEAAIAAKGDAISVYIHTKSGTAHELTLAGGGNNIKFVATDDFEAGDTLSVNSTPVTVYDSDGQLLGIPFRFGDVVLMLRNDDTVRVIAPLLFKPTVYPALTEVNSGTLDITSSAPGTATDYDLRFSIPQGYAAGMPISIDGTAVSIVSLDGMETDIDAVESAPISLTRQGSVAFWNQSGGSALNYKVIGSTIAPSNPSANTIWIETSIPIGIYQFMATSPIARPDGSPLQLGDLWLRVGSQSRHPFKAINMKNGIIIYGQYAFIWDGTAWIQVDAKIWQNSTWINWDFFYYSHGDEAISVTGGWGTWSSPSSAYFRKDPTSMYYYGYAATAQARTYTKDPIDLTGVSSIKIYHEPTIVLSTQTLVLGVGSTQQSYSIASVNLTPNNTLGPKTSTLNVSALSGMFFMTIHLTNSTSTGTSSNARGYICRIWTE